MEINHHFIKKKIEEETISLVYTLIALQTTSILIKTLSRTNFKDLRSKLGMINIYNPARGLRKSGGNPEFIVVCTVML